MHSGVAWIQAARKLPRTRRPPWKVRLAKPSIVLSALTEVMRTRPPVASSNSVGEARYDAPPAELSPATKNTRSLSWASDSQMWMLTYGVVGSDVPTGSD